MEIPPVMWSIAQNINVIITSIIMIVIVIINIFIVVAIVIMKAISPNFVASCPEQQQLSQESASGLFLIQFV